MVCAPMAATCRANSPTDASGLTAGARACTPVVMISSPFEISRRQALARLGGVSMLALSGCKTMAGAPAMTPQALLDDIAWNLLRHQPEGATSLGIDTDAHAGLRSKLT